MKRIPTLRAWLSIALTGAVAGCGGSDFESPGGTGGAGSQPADVAGEYSVAITNREDSCEFANWTEGAQTKDVAVRFVQNGNTVTGMLEGSVGGWVAFLLGSSSFSGSVQGDKVHAENIGTKSYAKQECNYTILMVMDATLTNNSLQGSIVYTTKNNGHADCGPLLTCQALQEFAGSRPPQ